MRSTAARPRRGQEPLVAVICATPLLCEGVAAAMEGVADVQSFPAGRGDIDGLLRWLAPDAVVVDRAEEARAATAYARVSGTPLLHLSLAEPKLLVFLDDSWTTTTDGADSTDELRNVLVGTMFRRSPTTRTELSPVLATSESGFVAAAATRALDHPPSR